MSTGATAEQIEAAIESRLRWVFAVDDTAGIDTRARHQYESQVKLVAPHLVPEGHAIVGPDVLDAIAGVVARERVDRALIGASLTDAELATLEATLNPERQARVASLVRESL